MFQSSETKGLIHTLHHRLGHMLCFRTKIQSLRRTGRCQLSFLRRVSPTAEILLLRIHHGNYCQVPRAKVRYPKDTSVLMEESNIESTHDEVALKFDKKTKRIIKYLSGYK